MLCLLLLSILFCFVFSPIIKCNITDICAPFYSQNNEMRTEEPTNCKQNVNKFAESSVWQWRIEDGHTEGLQTGSTGDVSDLRTQRLLRGGGQQPRRHRLDLRQQTRQRQCLQGGRHHTGLRLCHEGAVAQVVEDQPEAGVHGLGVGAREHGALYQIPSLRNGSLKDDRHKSTLSHLIHQSLHCDLRRSATATAVPVIVAWAAIVHQRTGSCNNLKQENMSQQQTNTNHNLYQTCTHV